MHIKCFVDGSYYLLATVAIACQKLNLTGELILLFFDLLIGEY
jgi:hypothetical protein